MYILVILLYVLYKTGDNRIVVDGFPLLKKCLVFASLVCTKVVVAECKICGYWIPFSGGVSYVIVSKQWAFKIDVYCCLHRKVVFISEYVFHPDDHQFYCSNFVAGSSSEH